MGISKALSKNIWTEEMEENNRRDIVQRFGINIQELPFVYLGVPIFKGHNKKAYFDDMVHNMDKHLNNWYHK